MNKIKCTAVNCKYNNAKYKTEKCGKCTLKQVHLVFCNSCVKCRNYIFTVKPTEFIKKYKELRQKIK